jgi:hypothetical protein
MRVTSLLALAAAVVCLSAMPNPELIGALASEIGATPKQATGAAGSLFSLAKTRLKPEEWTKVAGAVPGIDDLLNAAPAAAAGTTGAAIPGAAALDAGGLGGLSSVAGAFQTLGLKPDLGGRAEVTRAHQPGGRAGAQLVPVLSDPGTASPGPLTRSLAGPPSPRAARVAHSLSLVYGAVR